MARSVYRPGYICPNCGGKTFTVDSRGFPHECAVYRRRRCPDCGMTHTTVEKIRIRGNLVVAKKSGRSEPFNLEKMMKSMRTALIGREITEERLKRTCDGIIRVLDVYENSQKRVPADTYLLVSSTKLAQLVAESLRVLDRVGYVRYVSVNQKFYCLEQYQELLDFLGGEDLVHGDDDEASGAVATGGSTTTTTSTRKRSVLTKSAARSAKR